MARDPEMDLDDFLEHLSAGEYLEQRFGQGAADRLQQGKMPQGYAIHRIVPLFRGGTNRLSNLLLVKEQFRRNYNRLLCWYEDGCNPFLIGKSGGGFVQKLFGGGKKAEDAPRVKVACGGCGSPLDENSPEWNRVGAAVNKREPITLQCGGCRQYFIWEPPHCTTKGYFSDTAPRCPVSGCDGWVVRVQESPDSSFWGCGECGNVWREAGEFIAQIKKICAEYRYRASCYAKVGNKLVGVPLDKEPEDYRERVVEEDWDE